MVRELEFLLCEKSLGELDCSAWRSSWYHPPTAYKGIINTEPVKKKKSKVSLREFFSSSMKASSSETGCLVRL